MQGAGPALSRVQAHLWVRQVVLLQPVVESRACSERGRDGENKKGNECDAKPGPALACAGALFGLRRCAVVKVLPGALRPASVRQTWCRQRQPASAAAPLLTWGAKVGDPSADGYSRAAHADDASRLACRGTGEGRARATAARCHRGRGLRPPSGRRALWHQRCCSSSPERMISAIPARSKEESRGGWGGRGGAAAGAAPPRAARSRRSRSSSSSSASSVSSSSCSSSSCCSQSGAQAWVDAGTRALDTHAWSTANWHLGGIGKDTQAWQVSTLPHACITLLRT